MLIIQDCPVQKLLGEAVVDDETNVAAVFAISEKRIFVGVKT